jgi:DNA-binding HxlR family transcriptional regulator
MLSHAIQLQNENKYTVAVARHNLYLKNEELRTAEFRKEQSGSSFFTLSQTLSQLELVSKVLTRWHTVALKV